MIITRESKLFGETRRAIYSKCERYRYVLEITWCKGLNVCQFIGLNPSTATEQKDDPTVRRCKDFARVWGYGGMVMTNAFAFRATDPKVMLKEENPIGERDPGCLNLRHILQAWRHISSGGLDGPKPQLVACWGNHGDHLGQGARIGAMLILSGISLQCFGRTRSGHPKHPLYLAKTTQLIDLV